jgi:hypothetical protein
MEPISNDMARNPRALKIDVSDPSYARLASFAGRIAKLLSTPAVAANPNLAGSLDDFLGAIYALIFAKYSDFDDRTTQAIEVDVVVKRAEQINAGKLRTDGKWMAGFHFNSALFRAAAVYHRVLKIVAGRPTTKDNVPTLRTDVEALYRGWRKVEWTGTNIDLVHRQVNELKHTPRGIHDFRNVTYEDALAAVGELLDLVEAWNGAPFLKHDTAP